MNVGGQRVRIEQATEYPWQERIALKVMPAAPAEFAVALRIPAWCRGARVKVNGKAVVLTRLMKDGYVHLRRTWQKGDRVELRLSMPVERVRTNPLSRNNAGKVALQRGPVVYCLEEADNGKQLHNLALPREAKIAARFEKSLLGGVVTLGARGERIDAPASAPLYETGAAKVRPAVLKAVPYCVWGNRDVGEMTVWIREK
jgi:DUF1680 family protein